MIPMKLVTFRRGADPVDRRSEGSGQALVMFVLAIMALVGLIAIVIDVSWYWANSLRVQRAADAAALAGAVWLPGDPTTGVTKAAAEATKNGYTQGASGQCGKTRVCVTAHQDSTNENRMLVTVEAPVNTFFMRVFGINTLDATRSSKAEYVLPVPMGSPLNYFGVYGKLRTPSGWTDWDTTTQSGTSNLPTTAYPTVWNDVGNAMNMESPTPAYAWTASATDRQAYGTFGLFIRTSDGAPRFTKGGVQVFVKAHSSDATSCQIGVDLSWNGGTTWTTQQKTPTASGPNMLSGPTGTNDRLLVLGGNSATVAGDATSWWGRTWSTSDFSDANFRVRIQGVDPDPASSSLCTANSSTYVDYIQVVVTYQIPDPNVDGPNWEPLGPQGSWTGVLSQGAIIKNGDPYLAGLNGSSPSTYYNPSAYYDYAVEMSPDSANGSVSVFDPVYCATDGAMKYGMGDHWYSGTNAVSIWFDLYDTKNTPYDLTDDTWVAGTYGDPALGGPGTGNPHFNLFRNIQAGDSTLFASGSSPVSTSCTKGVVAAPPLSDPNGGDGRWWHDRWWPLATGLQGGHTYRIRVMNRDPANPSAQANTDALNNFSFFATAGGTLPRVYGLGSMVAFSPLPGGQNTEFYMAQIAAVHAGKTMRIQLYDPGDTGTLTATLQILMPNASTYSAVNFSYSANRIATGGANCNGLHGTNVSSVQTSNGGAQGIYDGCWLTITIPIPQDYSAPRPATETNPNAGGGWWKVRYVMGAGSGNATDLTTWKVNLTGNPVHLVVP